MENNPKETVLFVTTKIIYQLDSIRGSSPGNAIFANLRNSICKPLSHTMTIWPILYENFPESFLSSDKIITKKELAIINTLQLYALHQQGKIDSVILNKKETYHNIGHSISVVRNNENSLSIDRRFNAMISSATYEELVYHLRQMISILKSKGEVKIDYARLADDLYKYLISYEEDVKIRWAKAYYSLNSKGDKKDEL